MQLKRVALTGGVFQNKLLTELAAVELRDAGFEVLLHHNIPPNDGGIAAGQVYAMTFPGDDAPCV
jgi:hydrogenase maturation protein HypF